MSANAFDALVRVGLNLHGVIDVASLPAEVHTRLPRRDDGAAHAQLILIGNAGPTLWRAVQAARPASEHPIDDFSRAAVARWLAAQAGGASRHWLYPGDSPVGLQSLGALFGWHHPSPFMVGIQPDWGTWFAYRVAVLADTALPPTPPRQPRSPCADCSAQPCRSACPAGAMAGETFSLPACVDWRLRAGSSCAETCLARLACPVGTAHRYDEGQIRHGYTQSLRWLRQSPEAPGAPGRTHGESAPD
ncbi:hypothetical protein G3580_04250 [Nitrogeniibacter mangrovi]|uniref:4Fe-4S ferredoxin-type domain-containing protein n=1 Tax=Nitrogeniibacter mangrovi TaxID=2016596 RepID=A0A6C1B261_9RHOO|nr:hypothetical protein [Nitrogeniibacter mangrovi]QID16918.1 hypothetical protein G3580_04250 [Nitrogeniibacter mangrovi]